MDTLIVILIVAMATVFTVEFIGQLNFTPLDTRVITAWITFPVSLGYHYLLGTEYPVNFVATAASSFLALFLGLIVERISSAYTEIRRGRRG
jgi:hypothetical protein